MNDSKDHKAAAEPPLDCRVGRDELCLDSDGCILIDWATQYRDQLSISISPDGAIAWAALVDGRKAHGTAHLSPEAFDVLQKLVPNA